MYTLTTLRASQLTTARGACQQVSLFIMKHCGAEQAWQHVVFAAMSSSPKTISADSTPSLSSARLADVNKTWTGRRCRQTYREEDEWGVQTGGKREDKEMMTTVGDAGDRHCRISHWMRAAS